MPFIHVRTNVEAPDIACELAKQRLGAGFAITQMFFDPEDYLRFRDRARLAGVTIPLIPALAPMISVQRLRRMGQLSGLEVPERLIRRLEKSDTPEGQLDIGLDATAEMARTLLSNDTESLHLYTFNRADVTGELLTRIGIAPRQKRA